MYLCFEGVEKVLHTFQKDKADKHALTKKIKAAKSNADMLTLEKDKIRGAIRTDFILSA
nr:DUF808 family protein [Marinomonas ushuaiensis]